MFGNLKCGYETYYHERISRKKDIGKVLFNKVITV